MCELFELYIRINRNGESSVLQKNKKTNKQNSLDIFCTIFDVNEVESVELF